MQFNWAAFVHTPLSNHIPVFNLHWHEAGGGSGSKGKVPRAVVMLDTKVSAFAKNLWIFYSFVFCPQILWKDQHQQSVSLFIFMKMYLGFLKEQQGFVVFSTLFKLGYILHLLRSIFSHKLRHNDVLVGIFSSRRSVGKNAALAQWNDLYHTPQRIQIIRSLLVLMFWLELF